jgi:hypothetical protein
MTRDPAFTHAVSGARVLGARPLEGRHLERCRVMESREALLDHGFVMEFLAAHPMGYHDASLRRPVRG